MAGRTTRTANQSNKKPSRVVKMKRKKSDMDYTFLTLVIIMVCVGLVMLLSASTPAGNARFGNSYHFFFRQLLFVLVGFAAMLVISRIDYRMYKPYTKIFMIVCLVLLTLVLIPHVGVEHNGSRRWLNLYFMELQPSELMKLAIAMFFASMIEDNKYEITKLKGMLPFFMWIGITAVLMLLETHLSGTIVICGIAVVVMIVGGANFKFFLGAGAAAIPVGLLFLRMDPVRWERIMSFLNPFGDTQDTGYQVVQGLYAIGSGGIFGLGLGQSVQKYSYLPEPYNDFIFAIVCEELGLLGAALIIGLFALLIIRGVKIAMDAPDVFGSLTVVGIVAQVAIQTIMNIAVVTSSIPNTGISLPFFSYGGTAIMVLLAEMGVILSVSRYSKKGAIG